MLCYNIDMEEHKKCEVILYRIDFVRRGKYGSMRSMEIKRRQKESTEQGKNMINAWRNFSWEWMMRNFRLAELVSGFAVLTWCKLENIFEFAAEVACIIKTCVLSYI